MKEDNYYPLIDFQNIGYTLGSRRNPLLIALIWYILFVYLRNTIVLCKFDLPLSLVSETIELVAQTVIIFMWTFYKVMGFIELIFTHSRKDLCLFQHSWGLIFYVIVWVYAHWISGSKGQPWCEPFIKLWD